MYKYICKKEDTNKLTFNLVSKDCQYFIKEIYTQLSDQVNVNIIARIWDNFFECAMEKTFQMVVCKRTSKKSKWFDEQRKLGYGKKSMNVTMFGKDSNWDKYLK